MVRDFQEKQFVQVFQATSTDDEWRKDFLVPRRAVELLAPIHIVEDFTVIQSPAFVRLGILHIWDATGTGHIAPDVIDKEQSRLLYVSS